MGFGTGLYAAHTWAVNKVEQALQDRDIVWSERVRASTTIRWRDLRGPGLQAEELAIRAAWPPRVDVVGATIDLQQWPQDTASPGKSTQSQTPLQVHGTDLTIAWGDVPLLSNVTGEIWPTARLSGAQGKLSYETDEHGHRVARATTTVDLDEPHLRGTVDMSLQISSLWQLKLHMDSAIVEHPLVATGPLPPITLDLEFAWEPATQMLAVEGALGEVRLLGTGTAEASPPRIALNLRVPPTPLGSVLQLFGDRVPEQEAARTEGTVSLSATIQGPPWEWTLQPSAKDLSASGVIPSDFQRHAIKWTARDRVGNPVLRQTGPTHPGWTHLREAGLLPSVVMAAEDAGFKEHAGYQLSAIREAISAAQSGNPLRGGSTLTQQLAKNLFLNGERTLCRKLRELLYALDLERVFSKEVVLALYLNVVEFGPGIHGISEGADAYFLKPPSALTLKEAAFLASILPAPRTAWERARQRGTSQQWRVNTVLDRLAEIGRFPPEQIRRAKQEPLRFVVE